MPTKFCVPAPKVSQSQSWTPIHRAPSNRNAWAASSESAESQQTDLERAFRGKPDIEIVEIYHEAFSAKAPGRPVVEHMLQRLERGEADGIIAWYPDRLARNSIDGGRTIYLLDQNPITGLQLSTFT